MRNLILGLMMISSSAAFACDYQIAQVIGKVTGHYDVMTSENSSECFYQIKYTQFNGDGECPLDIDEVVNAEFRDSACALKDGDIVSGVLVKHGDNVTID